MTNTIASSFRTERSSRPDLIRPVRTAVNVTSSAATNLPEAEKAPVERQVSTDVLQKERKKAGVVRKGTKVEASRKALRDGSATIIHPVLDAKAQAQFADAEHVLAELTGVEPSKSILVRRAIAVYNQYLNSISANPEKALAELRAILRVR